MDNIDTCLVCGKEIPPGPDFCSIECEATHNAEQDIFGFIAWVDFCRWLREDFPAFSQAEALRSAGTKPCITLDAERNDQPDGAGPHWR